MWFHLAALWGCTVNEAENRCPALEFEEWKAYYALYPFDARSAAMQQAKIGAAIVQTQLVKGKRIDPKQLMLEEAKISSPDPEPLHGGAVRRKLQQLLGRRTKFTPHGNT